MRGSESVSLDRNYDQITKAVADVCSRAICAALYCNAVKYDDCTYVCSVNWNGRPE